MKFLTVLLISLAVILAQEVTANPVQVANNNIGDIRVVKIDINGTITNIINQVGWMECSTLGSAWMIESNSS